MKAFDEIYGLYARRLFAFCLKYTKSKENAEEIMEDTFVWLWNNRSTLEEADSVLLLFQSQALSHQRLQEGHQFTRVRRLHGLP